MHSSNGVFCQSWRGLQTEPYLPYLLRLGLVPLLSSGTPRNRAGHYSQPPLDGKLRQTRRGFQTELYLLHFLRPGRCLSCLHELLRLDKALLRPPRQRLSMPLPHQKNIHLQCCPSWCPTPSTCITVTASCLFRNSRISTTFAWMCASWRETLSWDSSPWCR